MGKSTISKWAIFNSYVNVYQAGYHVNDRSLFYNDSSASSSLEIDT